MKKFWWLLPVVLVGVWFLPLLGGKVIAPLDTFDFYNPWSKGTHNVELHNHFSMDFPELWLGERLFAWRSYRTDGWIGWSDLTFSGAAQYANTMNGYYDWSMQLNRWLPIWDAWHLGLFGQFVLAVLGMLVFLRSRGLSRGASLLGTVCYGMNSFFFTWMFHSWMLAAFCWLPWVVWSLYQLHARKPGGVLAPVFLCLGFLGGHLQFAAFYVIITAALCTLWIFEDFKKFSWRSFGWIGILGIAGGLAAGMASFMFVPCVRAYLRSTLEAGLVRGEVGYPFGAMQPLANLLLYPTYVFGYFLGRPQAMDFAKILHSNLFDVPFIGSLPLIFALVYGFRVLTKRGGERGAVLFMLVGLLLPLTPLVGPLYQRLFIIFMFGASWAAAHAVDQQEILNSKKMATILWRGFCIITGVWGGVSIAVFVFQAALQEKLTALVLPHLANHKYVLFQDWWQQRIGRTIRELQIWSPEMLLPWVAFGAAIFACRLHSQRRISRNGFLTVLIASTVLQLFWFNKNWISYSDRPVADIPGFEGRDFLQKQIKPWHRVATVQHAGLPQLFPLNTLGLFEIPHYSGYGSIVPPGIQRQLPMYTFADDLDASLFGKWGVTHAIGVHDEAGLPDGWKLVGRSGRVSLFANTKSRARYEAETDSSVKGLEPEIHEMNYRRLLLPENTNKLRILENWDEGWEFRKASGGWMPVKRADDRTMVAEIAPSSEPVVVEMRYRPLARRVGQAVSFATCGLFFVFAGVYLKWIQKTGPHKAG